MKLESNLSLRHIKRFLFLLPLSGVLILAYSNCGEFSTSRDSLASENLASSNPPPAPGPTPNMPPTPTPSLIENLAVQTLSKDGWYGAATEFQHGGPVIVNGKIFIAYMGNDLADRSHNIYAMMYEYATGKWTSSLVDVAANSGNDGHNAPSLYVSPDGYVEIYYGSLSAYVLTNKVGPYYKVSTKPYSIDSWGPAKNIPIQENNILGGFTPDGSIHLMGSLNYARRSPDGTWVSSNLIKGSSGALGIPGSIQHVKIHKGVIYFVWSPYNGSGAGRRLYLIKSADNGKTWTNINGTASFTMEQGLFRSEAILDPSWNATFPYPIYPEAYTIHRDNELGTPSVGILDDGTVVVVDAVLFRLWKWNGTAWVSSRIDPNQFVFETSLHVASDGKMIIHATTSGPTFYEIVEYVSSDRGANWQRKVLKTVGPESKNIALEVGFGSPFPGMPERSILQWSGRFNEGQSTPIYHSEILFLDRPLSK